MNQHKRIMGLDVGDKRIGVAVSDELRITAQPAPTIERTSPAKDFETIKEMAKQYEVSAIVVGLPKKLDGTSSPQTQKVQQFLDQLKEHLDVPVIPWDERFSTAAAEASLLEADMRRKARRKVIDSVAAQIILQHYLDSTPEKTGTA